jgi:hypothetical protein
VPKVKNAKLALPRVNGFVKIKISYDAVFSEFDRHLVGLGVTFEEQITFIGVDPPGGTTGLEVFTVVHPIPVADGDGAISVPREFTGQSSRGNLNEDPGPGKIVGADFDADEYRARIRIKAKGLPPVVTPDVFSNQEVLGAVIQPVAAAKP